jgi:hypothetical protein
LYKYGFQHQIDWINNGGNVYIKPDVMLEMTAAEVEFAGVVEQSTQLVGKLCDAFDTVTPSQCFAACELSMHCGGASFTSNYARVYNCFLFVSGQFTAENSTDPVDVWISFTKQTSGLEVFPIVKQRTRLVNMPFYLAQNMISPLLCFSACKAVSQCGGASFTTDSSFDLNCFFFRASQLTEGNFKEVVADLWTTYVKLNEDGMFFFSTFVFIFIYHSSVGTRSNSV